MSPGTHLVKNHESRPITNQSQIKKQPEIFKSFNHSLHSTKGGMPHDVMNYFASLRIFYASGTQDAEVTKSL